MITNETAQKEIDIEERYQNENDNYGQIEDEHPFHVIDTPEDDTSNGLDSEEGNPSMYGTDSIEDMINTLPENFPKAQQEIRDKIAPVLIELDGGLLEYYMEKLVKKIKASKKVINEELEVVKNDIAKKELQKKKEKVIDPHVQLHAKTIANDQHLFKNRISVVKRLGIIGEDKNIAMYCLVLDSRLLPNGHGSSEVLALKNSGSSGAGKSYPLSKVLEIYPQSAFHMVLGGSPKSLYFLEGGLKHKCLVIAEAFSFQNGNSSDSEFALVVRSILSEGQASYQYFSYDEEGRRVTKIQHMSGPTSLITTSIYGTLESQFENRLLTVHPDTSLTQTRSIISITAEKSSGMEETIVDDVIEAWKVFHGMLQPHEVVIPFANKISDFVTRSDGLPLSARRSFRRVISSIKTMTVLHQFQREKDDKGRLIAQIEDYFLAYQLVNESFRETLGEDKKFADRMELIRKNQPISSSILSTLFGISGPAVSQWVKENVEKGYIQWCDEDGGLFPDEVTLEKEKKRGKALLKISHMTGLPTPFQITGDPEWDIGGELYEKYDLGLDGNRNQKPPLPNRQLNEKINTVKDEKTPDNSGFDGEKETPVKELRENEGIDLEELLKGGI